MEIIAPPPGEDEALVSSAIKVSPPVPMPASSGGGQDEAVTSKAPQKWAVYFEVPGEGTGPVAHLPLYWTMTVKGRFIENGHVAWWREADEPVRCVPWENLNVSISKESCGWVGSNYQKYGHGYHITAQTFFTVAKHISEFATVHQRYISVYLYGDGHVTPAQYTECICNPFNSQSEQH